MVTSSTMTSLSKKANNVIKYSTEESSESSNSIHNLQEKPKDLRETASADQNNDQESDDNEDDDNSDESSEDDDDSEFYPEFDDKESQI